MVISSLLFFSPFFSSRWFSATRSVRQSGKGLHCAFYVETKHFRPVLCGFSKVVPKHEEGIASRAEARTHVGIWPQPAPASL